ncbi:MAG: hypothetical protein AAF614_08855 [Chloroflexota bacterium]
MMSLKNNIGSLAVLTIGFLPALAVGIGLLLLTFSLAGPASRTPSGIADLGPAFANIFLIFTLPFGIITLALAILSRVPVRWFFIAGIIGNIGVGLLLLIVAISLGMAVRETDLGILAAFPGLLFLFTGLTAVYGWSLRGQLSPQWAKWLFWGTIGLLILITVQQIFSAVTRNRSRQILIGHEEHVRTVAWSPDGATIASGDRNGRLLFWHLDQTQDGLIPSTIVQENDQGINTVAWSPNGELIAFDLDHEAVIFDAAIREEQQRLAHENSVNTLSWSPDGTQIALGTGSKEVTVWNVASGERLHLFHFEKGGIGQEVAWSPTGEQLAYNVGGGHFIIWDTTTGEQLAAWEVYARTGPIAWSPNGRSLAYYGVGSVGILDTTTGETTQELPIRNENVETIAWSPDGQRLAAGTSDNSVLVWNIESERVLLHDKEHQGIVWGVSWSPDGQQLVSGSSDTQVIIWSNVD